jgi:hypothetical protein
MASPKKRNGPASTERSRPTVPERVYSAAEVADALGVSKMTVLRYVDDGRMRRPHFFVQYQGYRVWLWNPREFNLTLDLSRAGKRRQRADPGFRKLSEPLG